MNGNTINPETIQLQDNNGNTITAIITWRSNDNTATIMPTTSLISGSEYKIVIATNKIKNSGGTVMGNDTSLVVSNFRVAMKIYITNGAWDGKLGGGSGDNYIGDVDSGLAASRYDYLAKQGVDCNQARSLYSAQQ